MWPTSRPNRKEKQDGINVQSVGVKSGFPNDDDKENHDEGQIIDIIQQWQISEAENENLRSAMDAQEISLRTYTDQNRMLLSELGQLRDATGSNIMTYGVQCNPLPPSSYAGYPFSRMSLYKSYREGTKYKNTSTETDTLALKHTSSQTGKNASYLRDRQTSTEDLVSGPTLDECKLKLTQKETIINELKNLNESTRKEVTELNRKLDQKEEEFQICSQKTEETQESCRLHMIQHEAKVKEKEAELNKSKKIVGELRKTTEQQYNELKRYKSQADELKSEKAADKKETAAVKGQITKLTSDMKTKEDIIGKTVCELNEVKAKRDQKIKMLGEEQKKIAAELKESKIEEQRRADDINKLQKNKEKCEELYREALKKVVSANSSIETLNKKIKLLEEHTSQKERYIGDLKKQTADMEKKLGEKETGLRTLDSTIGTLRQKLWEKDNLLRQSRSQLQTLIEQARRGAYGTMFQRWMQEKGPEGCTSATPPMAGESRPQGTAPKPRPPTDPNVPNKASPKGLAERPATLAATKSNTEHVTERNPGGTPDRKTPNNVTGNVRRKLSKPEVQRKGTESPHKELAVNPGMPNPKSNQNGSASKTNQVKSNLMASPNRRDLSSPSSSSPNLTQRTTRASTTASNIRVLQRPKVSPSEKTTK